MQYLSNIYTKSYSKLYVQTYAYLYTKKYLFFFITKPPTIDQQNSWPGFHWSNRSPTYSLGFFHRKIYVKFSCNIRDIWINLIHANLFCCLSDHATALERIAPPLLEVYELTTLEFVEFCCTIAIYKRGFIHFFKKLLHQFLVMASSSIHII